MGYRKLSAQPRHHAQAEGVIRRWARRVTWPSAPRDLRYASTYIFGAVCPQEGKDAALVLPFYNTAAMNLQLAENAILMARMLCSICW
jgi:hypothetical protein